MPVNEAKWTKIYSAGVILEDWAVDIHELIDHIPEALKVVIDQETPKMTAHAQELTAAAGLLTDDQLADYHNQTRPLYEIGQVIFRELGSIEYVKKVLNENRHTVSIGQVNNPPSMVYANAVMDSGAVVMGPCPWTPEGYDEIMPKRGAILHWPEHSDMMEAFSGFCGRYKAELRRLNQSGHLR